MVWEALQVRVSESLGGESVGVLMMARGTRASLWMSLRVGRVVTSLLASRDW